MLAARPECARCTCTAVSGGRFRLKVISAGCPAHGGLDSAPWDYSRYAGSGPTGLGTSRVACYQPQPGPLAPAGAAAGSGAV